MNQNYKDNPLIFSRDKISTQDEMCVKIDETFTTRFFAFMDYITKTYGASDMLVDEEGWYLKSVANSMNEYQRNTIDSTEEEKYFRNLNDSRPFITLEEREIIDEFREKLISSDEVAESIAGVVRNINFYDEMI